MRSRTLATVVSTALILAACGGDDTATTPSAEVATSDVGTTEAESTTASTAAPTTTAAAETTTTLSLDDLATAYAERGPYPVGVTTYQLQKGNAVEVWYPAAEGTTGQVTYDVRDFTPEAIRAILTGDASATYTIDAGRDATAAEGSFPVVLFSHGFTGIRLQSSFLTSHLASWGFVVAAPDHPSRDLPNVLGGTASGDRADSVDDLLKTLDLVVAEGQSAESVLGGRIDGENVVAVGHSAGGGTVLGAALDPRVDGYVSLASGISLGGDATTTTVDAPQLPQTPSFFMAGALDQVVPAVERTKASFDAVPAPSLLWILDGVGHNGFDDFCTFGNGTGIIGVAEASGLGGLLDAQPQLRRLGEDGCVPPAVAVTETFPIIQHAVTAWIRQLFAIDAAPVGLGPEGADAYAVPVTIEVRQ